MSTIEEVNRRLVVLFQQMYELTKPECAGTCRIPHSCCDPMYCEIARECASDRWGVDLSVYEQPHPKLPYMGASGCVLPPHYRPMCTLHTCEINGTGFKRGDPEWTERYFRLRAEIEALENDHYEITHPGTVGESEPAP